MKVKDFMSVRKSNHYVWVQYYSLQSSKMVENLYNCKYDDEEIQVINIDFMKNGDPCFKLTLKER